METEKEKRKIDREKASERGAIISSKIDPKGLAQYNSDSDNRINGTHYGAKF